MAVYSTATRKRVCCFVTQWISSFLAELLASTLIQIVLYYDVFRSLHRSTAKSRRVPGQTTGRSFRNENQSLLRRNAVRRKDEDPV